MINGELSRRITSSPSRVNLNSAERSASIIGGGTLLLVALKRPSWGGLILAIAGGALIHTGVTGHCVAAPTQRNNGSSVTDDEDVARDVHVEKSILINKDSEQLYSYWRRFENLPRIMRHLESVHTLDEQRSHWVAIGPAGKRFEWDAEIYNEKPGEMIAWRSLPGADIANAGSVHFEPVASGRGTKVKVTLNYNIPGGRLTAMFAKPFGKEPGQLIEDDLRRFKRLMETGEVPTVEGQSNGVSSSTTDRSSSKRAVGLPPEVERGRPRIEAT